MPSRGGRGRQLLWIRGVFWVRRDFFVIIIIFVFFLFERTRPAASMRPPCLIYLSTSNKARAKKPLHIEARPREPGCVQGAIT